MSQRVDIFDLKEPWKGAVTASIAFHGAILCLILAYGAFIGFSRNQWGGSDKSFGDAVNVTLAGASSIPLPHERQTENIVASESPAVTHSQPKEIPKPEPQAVQIPETTKIKPKEKPRLSDEKHPRPVIAPENQVQVGDTGGQVRQNFSTFANNSISVGASTATTGGDFGSRYAFYVRQIGQLLSQNWLKYEVDPRTMPDATVTVTFDIARNGQPTNVRIAQSSGVPSLDTSAVRTLERIDTFGPLPSDYRGSSVTVESQFRYIPTTKR